jgi:hypothetical protein
LDCVKGIPQFYSGQPGWSCIKLQRVKTKFRIVIGLVSN